MKKNNKLLTLLPLLLFAIAITPEDHYEHVSAEYTNVSTYSYTFTDTAGITTSGGDVVMNGKTWTTTTATAVNYYDSYGLQIGAGNNYQSTDWVISMPISELGNDIAIRKVMINVAGSFVLTVGYGEERLSFSRTSNPNDDYYVEFGVPRSYDSSVIITMRQTNISMYIKRITVEYVPVITKHIDLSDIQNSQVTVNPNINSYISYNSDNNFISNYSSIPGYICNISSDGSITKYLSSSFISTPSGSSYTTTPIKEKYSYFYITGISTCSYIDISYIEDDVLVMNNYSDYYLHLNDYNDNDGGLCHTYFPILQSTYNNLTISQKQMITDNEIANARLNSWISYNNASIDENNEIKNNKVVVIANNDNALLYIIITLSTVSVLLIWLYFSRKRNSK